MSKRKILGIPMDLRRPITEAEERVVLVAENWHYYTSVKVNGKSCGTEELLHRAVEAYEKETKI